MNGLARSLLWTALGVILGLLLFASRSPVHAYPEYTNRTGQQCTTCHVSPAGGGPRTLRGLLWAAAGKPDVVPSLPGGAAKPDGELDGATLFNQFECSRCHGTVGEGGVAAALNQTPWTEEELTDIIRNGRDAMKGYPPETISDAELNALIPYVQAIGRGEVEATVVLYKRPLPPPVLRCAAVPADSTRTDCGGN